MTEDITIHIKLIDELSIIILWIGIWGLSDIILNISYIEKYKHYIYILLILIAVYFKL
jgi:hypothetical protein